MYEGGVDPGLGFERLPQCDFEPADDGIVVKAYRLTFERTNRKESFF
ncbi:hypothetical protein [Neobacillus niacini]|nr:hypothetical protein [Neobacillus niacini]